VYGAADPPKAFQRHLSSFFTEIDIGAADGTVAMAAATPPPARSDVLRVSLWVVLFLARYYFDAIGDEELAGRAFGLFQRLRGATDGFYLERARAQAQAEVAPVAEVDGDQRVLERPPVEGAHGPPKVGQQRP
jgi:hypothetical protein